MSCLLPDPLKPAPRLQSCKRSSLSHHSFVFEGREVRVCTVLFLLLLLSRFSRVQLCATPETAAHQVPLSLGFSRQEHWSGLLFLQFVFFENRFLYASFEFSSLPGSLSVPDGCLSPLGGGQSLHRRGWPGWRRAGEALPLS